MKRIMWLCNTPLPEVSAELRMKTCGEGWLQGISDQLRQREDIELHYVFPQGKHTKRFQKKINNISFWGFYSDIGYGYEISHDRQKAIAGLIEKINPDIVHIFGTEFAHSLECIQVVPNRSKTIVSIQGLIAELAKVYTVGIPVTDWSNRGIIWGDVNSLLIKKYQFYRRGQNERKVLKTAVNVIGRTAWDQKQTSRINPECRYFYCSETMRKPFYVGKWNINRMQRYSIYISQANYPIKGFHIFIKAFRRVLQKYPQAVAYVAGRKDFLQTKDTYGCYIQKLIRKYKMTNNIVFLGVLSAEQVKERMLGAHILVMPSLLENSPNSIGEAMLLGVPIVAADVGGVSSLLCHGKEGILYPDHSVRHLAEGIIYVFEHDSVVRKMSSGERRRAQQIYDRKRNLKQLLSIYEKI